MVNVSRLGFGVLQTEDPVQDDRVGTNEVEYYATNECIAETVWVGRRDLDELCCYVVTML